MDDLALRAPRSARPLAHDPPPSPWRSCASPRPAWTTPPGLPTRSTAPAAATLAYARLRLAAPNPAPRPGNALRGYAIAPGGRFAAGRPRRPVVLATHPPMAGLSPGGPERSGGAAQPLDRPASEGTWASVSGDRGTRATKQLPLATVPRTRTDRTATSSRASTTHARRSGLLHRSELPRRLQSCARPRAGRPAASARVCGTSASHGAHSPIKSRHARAADATPRCPSVWTAQTRPC